MEYLLVFLGLGLLAALAGGGGGGGSDAPDGGGGAAPPDPTIEGSDLPDSLTGTGFDDVIFGRAGSDTIEGQAGNDYLDGNADDDSILGGARDDSLFGGGQDDLLFGEGGADFLRGSENADILEGGPNADTLIGISGDFETAPDEDTDGADRLEGWNGADIIVMGKGDKAYGEYATGVADGAGDAFVSGIWAATDPPIVRDYDPTADRLLLYYDAATDPPPEAMVTPIEIAGETTYEIALDNVTLMLVDVGTSTTVIAPEDVQLVPGSALT